MGGTRRCQRDRVFSGTGSLRGVGARARKNPHETRLDGSVAVAPRRMRHDPRDRRFWSFTLARNQARREEGIALVECTGRTTEDDPLLRPLAVSPAVHERMPEGVRQ